MASNLPSTQKEDWVLNDIVLPEHTNSWGSAINKLAKAIPVYASNGDYYKVESFSNNIITLSPVTDKDGLTNETVNSYIDGMQVIFQSTFNTSGNCSVNIDGLGVKQIKTIKNKPISTGDITLGNFVQLIYNKNADVFYLVGPSQNGCGLEVCDIGISLFVDETKGLRRRLNGQIVDINTNTQGFLTRLKQITTLYPSLLCTEEEWQSIKSASKLGQCGKFVFNYSGVEIVSVRIPAVVNINGLIDMAKAGLIKDESLPNIKGELAIGKLGDNVVKSTGALYNSGGSKNIAINGVNGTDLGIGFDASLSSSTYQDGAPVQPEAIQYPYFIQIATGSETENNIINEIELNNPYSLFDSKYSDHELNNLSWLKSNGQWNAKAVYTDAYDKLLKVYNGTETVDGLSIKLSTEEYTDYDFVLNTANETFMLPLKTKLSSGKAVVGNGMTVGLTNGTQLGGLQEENDNTIRVRMNAYGKPIGTSWQEGNMYDRTLGLTTDPTKSGIELSDSGLYLYFYVGETVQNANLINAGRIGEQLTNKIGRTECKAYITETYVKGTSGYRLYSDKYIEQWGYKSGTNQETITFLKAFKDTNYNVVAATEKASKFFQGVYHDKTTTNMKMDYTGDTGGSALGTSWMVTGYIA